MYAVIIVILKYWHYFYSLIQVPLSNQNPLFKLLIAKYLFVQYVCIILYQTCNSYCIYMYESVQLKNFGIVKDVVLCILYASLVTFFMINS